MQPGSGFIQLPNEFRMQPQNEPLWCWLAVASSIAGYYGNSSNAVSQGSLADSAFSVMPNPGLQPAECNQYPGSPYCMRNGDPKLALAAPGCRIQSNWQSTALPPTQIQQCLQHNAPIVAEIIYGPSFNHFVVIAAVTPDSDPTQAEVYLYDPMGPAGWISFQNLANPQAPGGWLEQTPAGPLYCKWRYSLVVVPPP
jgi:Papain-like cysteine protease AvrRpt2